MREKVKYAVASEGGTFLVSLRRALDGEGLLGGAYTEDIAKAKTYSSKKKAAQAASQLYRAVPYRVRKRDVLTADNLAVGDILINRYVGECKVEHLTYNNPDRVWVEVSYDAYVFARGTHETMRRADPVGVGDDGIAYFTLPPKTKANPLGYAHL